MTLDDVSAGATVRADGMSGESVRQALYDLAHLTWRGRLSMAYYALRRLFVAPEPTASRCVMGSPVGPHVWCPRRAPDLWCPHHEREIRRHGW